MACLVVLAPYLLDDIQAIEKAQEAIKLSLSYFTSTEVNINWFDRHKVWIQTISDSIQNFDNTPKLKRSPETGDLVGYQIKDQPPQIFVVQSTSGKSVRVIKLSVRIIDIISTI